MQLFDTIPWYSAFMWFLVVFVLILVNELARRNKWLSLFLFLVLPIVLGIFYWPHKIPKNPDSVIWFNWVKVYSSLATCLGFVGIRFIKGFTSFKYTFMFPALALALNILVAVIRDFQVYHLHGIVDGVMINGGPWNILNGVAGILNMVSISGWMGIYISKKKYKDMIWPDQLWFWILAYNLWNFAFVYNCVSDHSYYSGAALLASSIIPTLFLRRGAWLQHRAQTLAFWMMFTISFPTFVGESLFAVKSSHSEAALWFISSLSLITNMAVFTYHGYKIFKNKRNPLKEEVYIDLVAFHKNREQ